MVRTVRVLADPLTLGKPPPRFAPLNNGENQPARREGSRPDEVALGVEDTGPLLPLVKIIMNLCLCCLVHLMIADFVL